MADYEKQKQQVKAYFERMGISQTCAACGKEDWDLDLIGVTSGNVGGRQYYTVTIYCNNCGRTQNYDRMKVGL